MIRIHREGWPVLIGSAAAFILLLFLLERLAPGLGQPTAVLLLLAFAFELSFFRNPYRPLPASDSAAIYAPADGKVVVVEEVDAPEYFGDRRLQVSIFMSLTDVHVNRHPVSGVVAYYRYHPGRYRVAWHPKSSTENERSTIVYRAERGELQLRQIAGAVARRIITYPREGSSVVQGEDLGFIRFGSRVDLLLPLDAEILVRPGQRVHGNATVVARFAPPG